MPMYKKYLKILKSKSAYSAEDIEIMIEKLLKMN